MKKFGCSLLALLLLTACLPENVKKTTTSEIGRFQIIEARGFIFMMDTVDGRSWRWVQMYDEKGPNKRKVLAQFWEPETRFDNDTDMFVFTNSVEEQAAQVVPSRISRKQFDLEKKLREEEAQ